MPLITCPDCSERVSDRASSCLHCGCPIVAPSPTNAREKRSPISVDNQLHSLPAGISFIVPGMGQLIKGHFTKGAAIFGGIFVWTILFLIAWKFIIPSMDVGYHYLKSDADEARVKFYIMLYFVYGVIYFIASVFAAVDAYSSNNENTLDSVFGKDIAF